MTKTETLAQKKTRPGWATLAGMSFAVGGLGVVLMGLYFFTGAPGSVMAIGGLFIGVAAILGFVAAISFFMSRQA